MVDKTNSAPEKPVVLKGRGRTKELPTPSPATGDNRPMYLQGTPYKNGQEYSRAMDEKLRA